MDKSGTRKMAPLEGRHGSAAGREQSLNAGSQLPAAELTQPFGETTADSEVAGRMLAAVGLDDVPGRVTLKCDPGFGAAQVDRFHEITPGYRLNKRHWITIVPSPTLPAAQTEDLITYSYHLVLAGFPARVRPSAATPDW